MVQIALVTLNGNGAATVVNDDGLELRCFYCTRSTHGNGDYRRYNRQRNSNHYGMHLFSRQDLGGSNIVLDSSANAFAAAVTMKADTGGNEAFGNITVTSIVLPSNFIHQQEPMEICLLMQVPTLLSQQP